ncbi:MAG: hypothetical protein HZA17_14445 [Nitrospirae bacterium]|nr:hypothetical protein [Nitrospirota bacterium]
MAHDTVGRLISLMDAKGKSTYYTYDVMGRIKDVADPMGSMTRYFYAADGKLRTVSDAKNQDTIPHTVHFYFGLTQRSPFIALLPPEL